MDDPVVNKYLVPSGHTHITVAATDKASADRPSLQSASTFMGVFFFWNVWRSGCTPNVKLPDCGTRVDERLLRSHVVYDAGSVNNIHPRMAVGLCVSAKRPFCIGFRNEYPNGTGEAA